MSFKLSHYPGMGYIDIHIDSSDEDIEFEARQIAIALEKAGWTIVPVEYAEQEG